MRDLFRAEWIKIAGNRWVTSCLIWIFPVGAVAFIVIAGFILALSSTARAGFQEDEVVLWTENAIGVWSVPNNPLGRLLLLGFTGVVFAGEYQWSTWKSIVPRNRRLALILIKFVTLGAFVVLAFGLMSMLWTAGWGLLTQIAGVPYGPTVTGDVVSEFAGDYLLAASLAFTSTIIAAGYAALAAMFTHSILGGVLVAFAITFVENLSIVGLMLIGYFLGISRIVHLYRLTPGYNLINVSSWINDNMPNRMEDNIGDYTFVFSDSLTFSVIVLAVWVVGLIALTAYIFRRQDITT